MSANEKSPAFAGLFLSFIRRVLGMKKNGRSAFYLPLLID